MAEVVSTMVQVHLARYTSALSVEHLVIRRAADEDVFPGLWQCVTGRLLANERADTAARRESIQETGVTIQRLWSLPYVAQFYSTRRDVIETVAVFGILCQPDCEVVLSEEHDNYEWLSAEKALARLVIPAQKEATTLFESILTHYANDPNFCAVYELPGS